MTPDAGQVLAMGAAALVLACLSFIAGLHSIPAWTLRLISLILLTTVLLMAP
jgi:hypothetical protein